MADNYPGAEALYVSNVLLNQTYINWYNDIKIAESKGEPEPQIPPYIVESMIKIANRLAYRPNFINYSFKDEFIGDALVDCVRFAKKFDPSKMLFKIIISHVSGSKLSIKDRVVGGTSGHTGVIKHISSKTGKISVQMHQGLDFSVGEIISSASGKYKIEQLASHCADNPFSYITTICFNSFLRRIDKEKAQRFVKSKLVTDSPMSDFFNQDISTDDKEYKNAYIEFLRECSSNEDCTPMAVKRGKKNKIVASTVFEDIDE